jgi:hypothetical protein
MLDRSGSMLDRTGSMFCIEPLRLTDVGAISYRARFDPEDRSDRSRSVYAMVITSLQTAFSAI